MIQIILLMARTILHDVQLDFNELWPEAVRTAVYIRNCSPTSALPSLTSYEAWYGEKPSLGHIRPFGCPAYSLVLQEMRKKFESRTKHCILVGYVHNTEKIWRTFDPIQRRVFESANIVFAEDELFHPFARPHIQLKQIFAFAPQQLASSSAPPPISAPPSTSASTFPRPLPAESHPQSDGSHPLPAGSHPLPVELHPLPAESHSLPTPSQAPHPLPAQNSVTHSQNSVPRSLHTKAIKFIPV